MYLIDALRAYDAYTVQCKGKKTKKKHLNLPEEWAFPSPLGVCPPVHLSGGDSSGKSRSSDSEANSKNKRKDKVKVKQSSNQDASAGLNANRSMKKSETNSVVSAATSNEEASQALDALPTEQQSMLSLQSAKSSNLDLDCELVVPNKPTKQGSPAVSSASIFSGDAKTNGSLQPSTNSIKSGPSRSSNMELDCEVVVPNKPTKSLDDSSPAVSSASITTCDAKTNGSLQPPTNSIKSGLPRRLSDASLTTPKEDHVLRYENHRSRSSENLLAQAQEAKATSMLGHTRSTTKVIGDLIESTNPSKVKAQSEPSVASSNPVAQESSSSKSISVDAPTDSAKLPAKKSVTKAVYRTATDKELKYPALPSTEFGNNWTVRSIPRPKGNHNDKYWYSPIMGYRFRSRTEVTRFMECLKKSSGDEQQAIVDFNGSKKSGQSKRRPATESVSSVQSCRPPSLSQESSPRKTSPPPRFKVLEYIEPSNSEDDAVGKVKEEKQTTEIDSSLEATATEYIKIDSSLKVTTSEYIKPVIKKGEQVYACWGGNDGKGTLWYPGRTWDTKSSPGGEFGPVRKYDIVYDDGDMEPQVDEEWVVKKEEYEVGVEKPDEKNWIGVTNIRFEDSMDNYARLIGWYRTTFGGESRVYSSLAKALRSYDKVRYCLHSSSEF